MALYQTKEIEIDAFSGCPRNQPELETQTVGTVFLETFGAQDSRPRDRALSAPRDCLDAYKSDREKYVTRPHRAPVAQNAILGSQNPKSVTCRSVNLAVHEKSVLR